jgi:hypothetical protein
VTTLFGGAVSPGLWKTSKARTSSSTARRKQGKYLLVYSKIMKSRVRSDEPIVWYLSPQPEAATGLLTSACWACVLSSAMRQRFTDELKKSKGRF